MKHYVDFKRIVSSFACIAVLISSALPCLAYDDWNTDNPFGKEDHKHDVSDEKGFYTDEYYSDRYEPEPYVISDEQFVGDVSYSGYSVEPYNISDEFADTIIAIREFLTAHESEFSVDIVTDKELDYFDYDLNYSFFINACAHTGDSSQGDYISGQISSLSITPTEYYDSDNKHHIVLIFDVDFFTTKEQELLADQKARQIIDYLDLDGMTDHDKILNIYSYVSGNVSYDWAGLDNDTTNIEHSAYAALCEQKAVCQGYAAAVYKLMLMAGIDCRIITGLNQGIPHAWNIVCLNGKYYFIDATEDAGKTEFTYLLKCAGDMPDHLVDEDIFNEEFFAEYPVSDVSLYDSVDAVTKTANGYKYVPSLDGIVILSYVGDDVDVVVPAEIEGVPVKGLVQYSFYEKNMKSITISEGVEWISSLFAGLCPDLETIRIPSTAYLAIQSSSGFVSGIGGLTDSCYSLRQIVVADGNPYLCSIDGILYDINKTAILACPAQLDSKVVHIPEGVTRINDDCFSWNQNIEEVVLPESVTYIGYWSFYKASNLKKINIPKNCELIGQFAFQYTSLEELTIPKEFEGAILTAAFSDTNVHINVESGNRRYKVENNCFIVDGVSVLDYYNSSPEEVCIVPDGVTAILQLSFSYSLNLKKVVLPETMTFIDYDAFYMSINLEEINLPDSINRIEGGSFLNCSSLKSITLPSSLVSIYELTFSGTGLTEITIPKNVERIDPDAFSSTSINRIYVDTENEHFTVYKGMLFTKDLKTLIYFPVETDCVFDFPTEMETIQSGAFYEIKCSTVVFPKNLKEINDGALVFVKFDEMYIPKSVKNLNLSSLFDDLDLYYEGTEEEWNQIVTGEITGAVTYHFNCTSFPEHSTHHQLVIEPGIDPTDTCFGLTEGAYCSVCGEVVIPQEIIPSLVTGITYGWINVYENWYYYDQSGKKLTGWQKIGNWYYFDEQGVMQTGWIKDGGTWYYLKPSGAMYTGWLQSGSTWYYLKPNGAMAIGWLQVNGTWYYFRVSGAMHTGWLQSGGTWYYLESSGAMKTGWLLSGGKWYYLRSSGAMATGWIMSGNDWYYLDASGAMVTGWLTIGQYKYYFESDGHMVTGTITINGKRYTFDSDGHCLNP